MLNYPEALFTDLFRYYRSADDDEWAIKRKESACKINDPAFADFLISLIRKPQQDIIREYYKNNKSLSEIAREYDLNGSTISERKRNGLRWIRRKWCFCNFPSSEEEYHANLKRLEEAADLSTLLCNFPYPDRIMDALSKCKVKTVADLLALKEEAFPSREVWEDIKLLQHKFANAKPPERRPRVKTIVRVDGSVTLDTDIRQCVVSAGVFNALYGFGVRTVSDLLKLSGKEKIPRIGKVGWEEIKTMQKICADALQK